MLWRLNISQPRPGDACSLVHSDELRGVVALGLLQIEPADHGLHPLPRHLLVPPPVGLGHGGRGLRALQLHLRLGDALPNNLELRGQGESVAGGGGGGLHEKSVLESDQG